MTDDQAKSVANSGGVIGVTLVRPFLGEKRGTVKGVTEHIDHLVELLGDDHVSIGCDFDGIYQINFFQTAYMTLRIWG